MLRILHEAEAAAELMLSEKRILLENFAETLIAEEEIDQDRIQDIFAYRPEPSHNKNRPFPSRRHRGYQIKRISPSSFDTPSPSGFEEPIQKVVRDYIAANADEVRTDVHGKPQPLKNPDSPFKIMLAGHCDQIGFIINYIDADGFFLYFLQLAAGGPAGCDRPTGCRLRAEGPLNGVIGKKPIHLLNEEERKHVMKIQDLWIDIGAPDRESAEELVEIGDCATVELACRELLDERITAVATSNT